METNAKEKMKKIFINPEACKLLDRLVVSCNGPEVSTKLRHLLKYSFETKSNCRLSDIFPYQPITSVDIYRYAIIDRQTLIDTDDILEIFGGKIHLDDAEEWVKNYKKSSFINGKLFAKHLEEFGIDLEDDEHRAIFLLLDVLGVGTVKKISGPMADIELDNIKLTHACIPKDLRVKKGSIVGTHYGVVINLFTKKDEFLIKCIKKSQSDNKYFQKHLDILKGKMINLENVYKTQTKPGYDVLQRFLRAY